MPTDLNILVSKVKEWKKVSENTYGSFIKIMLRFFSNRLPLNSASRHLDTSSNKERYGRIRLFMVPTVARNCFGEHKSAHISDYPCNETLLYRRSVQTPYYMVCRPPSVARRTLLYSPSVSLAILTFNHPGLSIFHCPR